LIPHWNKIAWGNPSPPNQEKTAFSVVILPDKIEELITACGYIRLVAPFFNLSEKTNNIRISLADFSNYSYINNVDMIVCQRHVARNFQSSENLLNHCQKNKIKLLYDLDDDLINIPEDHSEFHFLNRLSGIVLKFLREADAVWVSTKGLKEKLKHIRQDITIMPNKHDDRIWKKKQRDVSCNEVRLVYMGTPTHDEEYEFLEIVGKQLYSKYKDQITIDIVGATTKQFLPAPFRRIVPDNPDGTYPGFVEWFTGQSWDIGLAPLMDNEFNKSKSAIKLMDYAALELTIIASKHLEYFEAFGSEHAVHYVDNNTNEWFRDLCILIDNEKIRNLNSRFTHAHYIRNHTFNNGITKIEECVNNLLISSKI
jgi:glycosyltransferase involved in cell wall biosynthesis